MAQWTPFAIQLPGKDFLEPARNALETLLIYLEVVKAVLETIKAFLIDFGNPIRALVEALLNLIATLITALKRSGVYAYYDVPDPVTDPSFARNVGGYKGFARRFKQSLLDVQDLNRPQPLSGALKGGYVIIVADADAPLRLLALLKTLLKFFGQEFLKPQYGAPANVRVVPVGSAGDPLLSVASVFSDPPTALAVEWALPSTVPASDDAFTGIAAQVSQEFYPPKWLIERSEAAVTQEVPDTALSDPTAAGYVTKVVPSRTVDFRTGQQVQRKIRVQDENGAPFLKFQTWAIVSAGSNTGTFILGQLGTFRYIDTSVQKDRTYYYRVRAYSGELPFEGPPTGPLTYNASQIVANMNDGGTWNFVWLAKDPSNLVVMGRASGVVRGRIPTMPANFDVLDTIRRVFLAALSLNFHLGLPQPLPVLDAQGAPVPGPDGNPLTQPLYAPDGSPLPPLDPVTDVGRGSLADLAGPVGTKFLPDSFLNVAVPVPINPATGGVGLLPWQLKAVRFHAARLANKFGSLFLDLEGGLPESFRQLMQGPLPAGTPPTASLANSTLAGADTLEKMVYALTAVDIEQGAVGAAASAVLETTVFQAGTVTEATRKTYGSAYNDVVVRRNVLAAVNFLLNVNGQGVPPDWQQIAILRDMIPWSGQLLYELLAKIQALLDAFKGLMDEVKAFIDLIIRKIDTLERFLQFLIDILNYIESLQGGFYFLNSGTMGGDVTQWMQTLDQATNPPPSGPGGYTAGVAFAYLAVDVAAFEAAFGLIFLCLEQGMARTPVPATCHPERVEHTKGSGLCASCYNKQRLASNPPSTCHPDRPRAHSSGICQRCYDAKRRREAPRATCHPDRPVHLRAEGLCAACALQKNRYGKVVKLVGRDCGICGDPLSVGVGQSAVDHDHRTGKVRGTLCGSCNKMLGFARDNPRILQAAIEYLSKHEEEVAP